VQVEEFDRALRVLSGLAEELIKQGNTSSLMESLRLIWSKSPQHLPTLELMYRICDEREGEYELPEILEALGHAYVQGGQFEKAEQAFQMLASREPANEHYKALLKQVLKKQGKEIGEVFAAGLPSSAIDLTQEEGLAAPAAAASGYAEREAMVKQALDNSELLARYNLVKKAVAELDRVLEIYPDEPEIHRRLVGLCWNVMPERAEQAARALVRIYTQQGDTEGAKRFAQMAGGREALAAEATPPKAVAAPALRPEPLPPPPAQPAPAAPGEIELASDFSLAPVQEPETAPPPHVSSTASAESTVELSRPPEQKAPGAPPAEIPFDSSLAQGVKSPTATAVGTPSDPSIPPAREAPLPAPLQLPIDPSGLASSTPPPAPTVEIQEVDLAEDWESFQTQAAPASLSPETPHEPASFNYEDSRIEINFYLENRLLEEATKAVEDLESTLPGEPRIAELRALVEARTSAMAAESPEKQPMQAATNLLGDLADAFGSAIGELAELSPPPAPPSAPTTEPATISTAPTPAPASPLSGLLEEMGEAFAMGPDEKDDPETHYNLGVAFREMNLLDEAIGEFQKVASGAGKGPHPPNYLQACSLLAICFMDKGMAPIAIKWYCRALESPDLDEEALLALQYDLGVAFEQSGDTRRALEKFTEVYGQNIDFRDVAEKIRIFQQKGS
jgi:tetratricopeptide (TPR) repeat protein